MTDRDAFDAFLRQPLEYSLGLQSLAVGTAEMRALRQHGDQSSFSWLNGLNLKKALFLLEMVGFLVFALRLGWRGRKGRTKLITYRSDRIP